ncbi:MAG: ATP-binding protein [Myxococcales bacterium]
MTTPFKVTSLLLTDSTPVPTGRLTIFIGANNVGKTRALKDIYDELTGSALRRVVVTRTDFQKPATFAELQSSSFATFFEASEGGSRWTALSSDLCGNEQRDTHLRWPQDFYLLYEDVAADDARLSAAGLPPNQVTDLFAYYFGPRLVTFLKTSQRLQLLERGQLGTGGQGPQSLLEHLLDADQAVEDEVHRRFVDAFQTDFVLDYSELHRLRIMVGPGPTSLPEHPRKLREALANHLPLESQGDGIRAFLGLVTALISVDRPVVLVDEPETFLHPPQARRIGALLAEDRHRGRQTFVSTHSVDVLRGVIANTNDVQIVRLSRRAGKFRGKVLDPSHLSEIAGDPVLSSARALEGLFYSCVVVVEGDRDARFFHAVADRLRSPTAPYFLAAGGKQTIAKLAGEYRKMEVSVAAIVDFDIFREAGTLLELAQSFGMSAPTRERLADLQKQIAETVAGQSSPAERQQRILDGLEAMLPELKEGPADLGRTRRRIKDLETQADPWRNAKKSGKGAFSGSGLEYVEHAFVLLKKHGIFVCPGGELESFFPEESRTKSKAEWLASALLRVAKYEVNDSDIHWSLVREVLSYVGQEGRLDEFERVPK